MVEDVRLQQIPLICKLKEITTMTGVLTFYPYVSAYRDCQAGQVHCFNYATFRTREYADKVVYLFCFEPGVGGPLRLLRLYLIIWYSRYKPAIPGLQWESVIGCPRMVRLASMHIPIQSMALGL